MDEMKISITLANELLGYLGSRPYQEVFQLIDKMQGAFKEAQMASQMPVEVQKVEAEPV
jgi:hypothetical protein